MSVYPEKVTEILRSCTISGKCLAENVSGTAVNFDCGCFVRFSMEIDDDSQTIDKLKFTSNGCGYMVAAASIYGKYLDGKALTDLHGLDSTGELGDISRTREPCLNAVCEAAKNAFAAYRTHRLEEFTGEKALICTCFGVSEEAIEEFINAKRPVTINDVIDSCRAGGGCGSCRFLIQEMIDSSIDP